MAKKFPEIKEKNEGKFTAWVEKNMSGMDTCKAASKIMRSRTKKYSPAVVKMANYANNFGCKTKKDDGASVPLKGKQKNLPDALKSKILASDGASAKGDKLKREVRKTKSTAMPNKLAKTLSGANESQKKSTKKTVYKKGDKFASKIVEKKLSSKGKTKETHKMDGNTGKNIGGKFKGKESINTKEGQITKKTKYSRNSKGDSKEVVKVKAKDGSRARRVSKVKNGETSTKMKMNKKMKAKAPKDM